MRKEGVMSSNPPLEKTIVKSILDYLNSLEGCRALKRHGGRLRGGEPDIYGSYYGRHIEFEVKRPRIGKTTPRQESCLKKWRNAYACVAVVNSKKDVMAIIEGLGGATLPPKRQSTRGTWVTHPSWKE